MRSPGVLDHGEPVQYSFGGYSTAHAATRPFLPSTVPIFLFRSKNRFSRFIEICLNQKKPMNFSQHHTETGSYQLVFTNQVLTVSQKSTIFHEIPSVLWTCSSPTGILPAYCFLFSNTVTRTLVITIAHRSTTQHFHRLNSRMLRLTKLLLILSPLLKK